MSLNAQNDIASRIEDAVFELMATTPVQSIKVAEVLRLAHTSKSTFYRCYRSVDDVVKRFEDELLQNMQDINDVALEARFGDAQLDPTPTMIKRMEILKANRSKVLALNSDNGDPVFAHKATIFMHDYFRNRLRSTFSDETDLDLYLAFALAGHHNLIQYWLLRRAPLPPPSIACSTHRSLSTMHRVIGTHVFPILKGQSRERSIFGDKRLYSGRVLDISDH